MTVLIFFHHSVTSCHLSSKERLFVWLPLRGAVDAVDCRVAFLCFMLYAFCHHSVTSCYLSSRRAFLYGPPFGPLPKGRLVDIVDCGVVIYLFHFSDNISIWSANFAKSLLAIPSQLLATASNLSAAAISLPNTVAARFVVFFFCTRMPYVCTTTSPVSKS